jgi:long-chain acyl-CoA synthetase
MSDAVTTRDTPPAAAHHPLTVPPETGARALPLEPSKVLAGARLVVVGGTGFLGKVWLAQLLDRYPEIGHLYLLVRAKKDQTSEERFWAQVASSPVFDPLRGKHPGAAFERFLREKVTAVSGDIAHENLGLDAALVDRLRGTIHAVVNVAGVVDFNPPLDEALEVNAFGVNNLVSLAKKLGAKVMHTSTCYVAGYRAGLIEELDPREVPFPRSTGETWFGAACPHRTLERSHWDPQREIDECMDLVKQARQRCEDAFRQSAFLDTAKANLTERGEPTRGTALADELAKVKRKFVEAQLVEAGKERAIFWGFTNIYTYTKSIGEQVLAASGVPFCIVRPAIVESSVEFPFPGWNEGINTSAPYLYLGTKGLVQFPGSHDVRLDLIPVDMVTSGMIASLAELLEGTEHAVYQYATTDTNGARLTRFLELSGLYKRKLVFEGKKTSLFDYVSQHFEPRPRTPEQFRSYGAPAMAKALKGLGEVLAKAAVGPAEHVLEPASKMLLAAAKTEQRTADIQEVFVPFVAEADWIFSCVNTRAAFARMPPEERARLIWAPESLDWRDYLWNVHYPGLEKWVFPLIDERLNRETKPLRRYDTLLDLLDEMAERYDHAVALQLLTDEGLTRTTFREWRDASRATAARLAELGVRPGDRVLLSGQNQPAWPIAYFGILAVGAVAVPVDGGLEAAQVANMVRSSHAKVALVTPAVEQKVGEGVRAALGDAAPAFVDVVAITEADSEAPPDTSLAPPPFTAKGSDLASIIYTSGTTGDPKGVMLTHANFAALLASLAPIFPLAPTDRVLSVLPLHHTFEFTCGMLLPLSRGARILYLGEISGERLSDGLKRGRITGMVGVPALWQLLERRVMTQVKEQGGAAESAFDWALELNRLVGKRAGMNLGRLFFGSVHDGLGGNVRWLISGGAALPKETAEFFKGIGLPLSEGYGLTEAAPVLTVAKASMRTKPGHVGKPVPGVEVKIRNPDETGVGEVVARGPNVMLGYANNPEATSAVLDEGGWLRTGDLGKLDKKKHLVLVGRQKDVIVSASGENVYPDDVEAMLGTIEGVKELAIVGVDDPKGGERVACLAVPAAPTEESGPASRDGERRAEREKVMKALREAFSKLPRAAQPAVVHLYEADLPRTATRKVKRPEVKAILGRLVAASAPQPALVATGTGITPARFAIATIANKKPHDLTASTSLRADLGFDSLMSMELAVALEAHAGRSFDSSDVAKCDTVGDVERMVAEAHHRLAHGEPEAPVEIRDPDAPIVLPPAIAEAAKRLIGKAQVGFYDQVMHAKVTGRAYIPQNRNTIVCSNHASHLDMGLVRHALGRYGEDLVSLAAQDYFFEDRWRRAFFENFTNLAAFDRKGGLRQSLRQAGELIDQGKTVLLFPEGTRSEDGALHDFKPAIGHLALTHGVDILPVYLGGTFEAMPKGRGVPTKRDLAARIGPPLEVAELRRLTQGMKFPTACRAVATLAHRAVAMLKEGQVLDLKRVKALLEDERPEHPMVVLFRDLEKKFVPGSVDKPTTFYFTLGSDADSKWTVVVDPARCEVRNGKPPNDAADCVLKTSQEIFSKIVREKYTPSPVEFMSGLVKSNDISLLFTFQKAFDLG